MGLAADIAALFEGAATVETGVPGEVEGALFPEEAVALERAVEKRRREFVAGRVLARRALARLGASPAPIPRGDDRAPIWPNGYVGTISHTRSICAAAVARDGDVRSLGLDVEDASPLAPELVARICTAPEEAWLAQLPGAERGRFGKLFFSAKEAFYKCQYPLTGRFLEFHDAELAIDVDARTIAVAVSAEDFRLPPGLTLRFRFQDGLVLVAARTEMPG
jgi:4'-phosphopantetheinyl transferase EntD